jgi:hypothetical protein
MFLDSSSKTIQVLLGGAVSATELDVMSTYEDEASNTDDLVPGVTATVTTGATAITAVPAPGNNVLVRRVKSITIHNNDSATATVTVRHKYGSTYNTLNKTALTTGETLHWTQESGWRVTTTGGALKSAAADLTIASEARGDLARRNASSWGRFSAKTAGASIVGDGTDVVLANTAALIASTNEYKKQRCYMNFLKARQVPIFKKASMVIVTAAAEEDFFHVDGNYFELSQPTANTALATTGLAPGASGWLLPGDNTAADYMELTRGIVLGSAQSFLSGTDAFFLRVAFLITTRANHTHLYAGFRKLGAYADTKTNTDHLAAYDDKAAIGVSTNAGVLTRHVSLATTDTALNATHAAAANLDVLALEIGIASTRVCTFKVGHATPAGSTAAEYEAARVAAIADLATDATWAGTAFSVTTAINFVPYIAWGMAGSTAISDTTIMHFECDYQ